MGLRGIAAVICVGVAVVVGLYQLELSRFRTSGPVFPARWVNWIGEFGCPDGVVVETPRTLEELQAAVRRHSSVRAAATGHSFNLMHCPESPGGAVISTQHLTQVEIFGSEETGYKAVIGAGVKMGQLQNEVLARGLTLRVPPGNNAYTIGGCIATGCHNLGQSHATDLQALSLVLHNGTVTRVRRSEPDFSAAAVSLGRLGVIYNVTMTVLPYRPLSWSAERLPRPSSTNSVMGLLHNMTLMQVNEESTGNKLVFYLKSGVMMTEHWRASGRSVGANASSTDTLEPYLNPQSFRIGQGALSVVLDAGRRAFFGLVPAFLLGTLQRRAEDVFRGLHTSESLSGVRQALGWQHSPEARGEASAKPAGLSYSWAAWADEAVNLLMGLRHLEVIFPLEPRDRAARCLDVVFSTEHLVWWRLNVRTMRSENFYMSSTYNPANATPVFFLRVDCVVPGAALELHEKVLTDRLRAECPGWRKHWGKGLFDTSAEERWGDAGAFLEAVRRYDPRGKFHPLASPSWLPSPSAASQPR